MVFSYTRIWRRIWTGCSSQCWMEYHWAKWAKFGRVCQHMCIRCWAACCCCMWVKQVAALGTHFQSLSKKMRWTWGVQREVLKWKRFVPSEVSVQSHLCVIVNQRETYFENERSCDVAEYDFSPHLNTISEISYSPWQPSERSWSRKSHHGMCVCVCMRA